MQCCDEKVCVFSWEGRGVMLVYMDSEQGGGGGLMLMDSEGGGTVDG